MDRPRHFSTPTRGLLALALLLLVGGAVGPSLARQLEAPAAAPTGIRPLLLGSEVPAASVQGLDGAGADLREIVLGKPTLLLFYRGGW